MYVERVLAATPQWSYEMFPTDASKGYAAANNEGHFYKECSGTGTCDRTLGQCTCFAGYTGAACQRSECASADKAHARGIRSPPPPPVLVLTPSFTLCPPLPPPCPPLPSGTCPSDCSGNGVCRTLREVAAGALSRRAVSSSAGTLQLAGVRSPFDYSLWDADKHQMCVCDAGFEGADCAQRTCPRGDDPLTPDTPRWCGGQPCAFEVQTFRLSSADSTLFRFTYVDLRNGTHIAYASVNTVTGNPGLVYDSDVAGNLADPSTNAGIIMAALRSVPGGALQDVEVRAYPPAGTPSGTPVASADQRTFQVTFTNVYGNLYNLIVDSMSGPGFVEAAASEVVQGNREDTECSGRGICDTATSLCKCFSGYYGVACSFQNALAGGAGSSAGSSK